MGKGADKRTQRSRQRILTAAEKLFLQKGFLATSMDEIAEAADVSKQTVYARFTSKEALFVGIVETLTGMANDTMAHDFADPVCDRPVKDFLLDTALQNLQLVMTPRLMSIRRLVIAEAERFPAFGEALYKNGPELSIVWLAKAIRIYARKGELKVDDATEAATFMNWLVMGEPTNTAMFLGLTKAPHRGKFAKHAKEAVRIFLAAYGRE
jgi:TetR/AcrR family transcriptional regulator, mexJK operon transcriptional repressor